MSYRLKGIEQASRQEFPSVLSRALHSPSTLAREASRTSQIEGD
jgi:hypothetical protein